MAETNQFERVGGHPLLDLVNTEVNYLAMPNDLLKDAEDFWVWLDEIGIDGQRDRLDPNEPFLPKVREFRQQMRLMLEKLVRQGELPERTIPYLNDSLRSRRGHIKLLLVEDDAYVRHFVYDLNGTEQIIGMLADLASHFLALADVRYLKRCENKMCSHFFLDTSRNHSRRWCSMQRCGNRMKARAHYARQRRHRAR